MIKLNWIPWPSPRLDGISVFADQIWPIIVWICWSLLTWSLAIIVISEKLVIPGHHATITIIGRCSYKQIFMFNTRLKPGIQQQKPMIWHSLKTTQQKMNKIVRYPPKTNKKCEQMHTDQLFTEFDLVYHQTFCIGRLNIAGSSEAM